MQFGYFSWTQCKNKPLDTILVKSSPHYYRLIEFLSYLTNRPFTFSFHINKVPFFIKLSDSSLCLSFIKLFDPQLICILLLIISFLLDAQINNSLNGLWTLMILLVQMVSTNTACITLFEGIFWTMLAKIMTTFG